MRQRGGVYAVALAGLIGVLVGAGLVLLGMERMRKPSESAQVGALSPAPPAVTPESQDAIAAAVAKAGPAIVNINTLVQPKLSPMEEMLRGMMGLTTDPFPRPGQGSGIIIDGKRGYVLTNAHMVEDATAVEVVLADNRHFKAKVIGSDPLSDVAVVQIPGGDLPEASLGSSGSLPIGSLVIAIGNPFGYENSVTMGVISAKHRQIRAREGVVLQDLLQTDAAINPGNSGGALIDLSGNVVGMPTAIIRYAQGIGFAVSVDVAKLVAERIIATGRMAWPWIGISLRSMNPEEAKRMGTPDGKGTLVVEVAPSGPAARAGLRPHDVILKLGETPTPDGNALLSAVRTYKVGDRVALTVWRTGKEAELTITLGEMPVR